MTISPEDLRSSPNAPQALDFNPEVYIYSQLFVLGYAESEPKTLYKTDNFELTVRFRTLTPNELRDVFETVGALQSTGGQAIVERIETLARSIVTINHAPLVLTKQEQEEYAAKYGNSPSPLAMARTILNDKIKSLEVIDLLYTEYVKFANQVSEDFEKAKKK